MASSTEAKAASSPRQVPMTNWNVPCSCFARSDIWAPLGLGLRWKQESLPLCNLGAASGAGSWGGAGQQGGMQLAPCLPWFHQLCSPSPLAPEQSGGERAGCGPKPGSQLRR